MHLHGTGWHNKFNYSQDFFLLFSMAGGQERQQWIEEQIWNEKSIMSNQGLTFGHTLVLLWANLKQQVQSYDLWNTTCITAEGLGTSAAIGLKKHFPHWTTNEFWYWRSPALFHLFLIQCFHLLIPGCEQAALQEWHRLFSLWKPRTLSLITFMLKSCSLYFPCNNSEREYLPENC